MAPVTDMKPKLTETEHKLWVFIQRRGTVVVADVIEAMRVLQPTAQKHLTRLVRKGAATRRRIAGGPYRYSVNANFDKPVIAIPDLFQVLNQQE